MTMTMLERFQLTCGFVREKACEEGFPRLDAAILQSGLTLQDSDPVPIEVASRLSIEDIEWSLEFLPEECNRDLRLHAVWCCRQIDHLITDSRSRNAVEIAERFANGLATRDELVAAREAAGDAARGAAGDAARDAARDAAWAAAWGADWGAARYAARGAARDAAWAAAWGADWDAARDAARGAAWGAARGAAGGAARYAARGAAWGAARGAAGGAARDAARDAAWDAAREAQKQTLLAMFAGKAPWQTTS